MEEEFDDESSSTIDEDEDDEDYNYNSDDDNDDDEGEYVPSKKKPPPKKTTMTTTTKMKTTTKKITTNKSGKSNSEKSENPRRGRGRGRGGGRGRGRGQASKEKEPEVESRKRWEEDENSDLKWEGGRGGGGGASEEKEPEEVRKWWEEDSDRKVGQKQNSNWKWRTLVHNGVYFPPDYVPHGVKMLYDGKEVELTPEQEEWATYFARYLETDHIKKEMFSQNFFSEWKVFLGNGHVIKEFSKCDFTPILSHLKIEQEEKKNRTKEEKEKEKKAKEEIKDKYGYAIVDGLKEQIGNFIVEPPGLFLGRGLHPKTGMFKRRIEPEQITINVSEGVNVPCPIPGHEWGAIIHNHEVIWLATWRENINDTNKFVFFSAQSSLRGRSDRLKFETARKLNRNQLIIKIRKDYMNDLTNKEDSFVRQRATAIWVIDRLALRVGNDKGIDESDTVGCCSLRCEHVKLHDTADIELDFLGKDSLRYHNRVTVIPQVYQNFKGFMEGKSKDEKIFDRLSPLQLNAHFQSLMEGLTAKVFRIYNTSATMQQELSKFNDKDATVDEKVLFFNHCCAQVAVLCHHQRPLLAPTRHISQMQNIDQHIEEIKEQIKQLDLHEKDNLKEVSISTSKMNYIDPRISLAWCKKYGVDIKKIFSTVMRNKFAWAITEIEVEKDFEF